MDEVEEDVKIAKLLSYQTSDSKYILYIINIILFIYVFYYY